MTAPRGYVTHEPQAHFQYFGPTHRSEVPPPRSHSLPVANNHRLKPRMLVRRRKQVRRDIVARTTSNRRLGHLKHRFCFCQDLSKKKGIGRQKAPSAPWLAHRPPGPPPSLYAQGRRRPARGRNAGRNKATGSKACIARATDACFSRRNPAVKSRPRFRHPHGFSLVELSMALTIFALLAATSSALLFGPLRDHQFMTFAVLVCGDFQRALSQAQTSYRPIRMNLNPEQDAFYKLEIQLDRNWHTLSLPLKHSRYQGQISMSVKAPLPHPHDPSRQLTQAFRSSHAPYFYFRRRGSSSGTLAFSDPSGRTLCFVLAGDNNRLRAYLWLPSQEQWQALL